MDFVLVPGAWAGEWIWDEVASELHLIGHKAHPITLSGLDPSNPTEGVSLRTHVEDVRSYITANGIDPAILVGHSYSGIVVGQVASQFPNLVHHTIFIEAFLPISGKSLLEVSGLDEAEERDSIEANGGKWLPPSPEELAAQPKLNDSQIKLLEEQQQPHPGKTVLDRAEMDRPLQDLSASFVAHKGWLSGSLEQDLVEKLRASGSWAFHEIDGGHWPMLTVPKKLANLLHSCVI
ncbi:MAG: alpha/beta fold hydrolase [candidate division Zixibacteria bacterium]|nr:alpha/beta fold hydrolase [candidate division Zixibacteria bacterium]